MTADLFSQKILPLFEQTRADWLKAARSVARDIAAEQGSVTIDDVRAACPPPADVDPRVMGAVMRKPNFVPVGYQKSSRATCHNRPIAVFRLASVA